jgi:hypothetical protein
MLGIIRTFPLVALYSNPQVDIAGRYEVNPDVPRQNNSIALCS